MTYTWPDARRIAKGIVSDWMHLEADERRMDALVDLIKVELERAFANGIRASEAATLERAAKVAEDRAEWGKGMLKSSNIGAVHQGACIDIAVAIRALKEPLNSKVAWADGQGVTYDMDKK